MISEPVFVSFVAVIVVAVAFVVVLLGVLHAEQRRANLARSRERRIRQIGRETGREMRRVAIEALRNEPPRR